MKPWRKFVLLGIVNNGAASVTLLFKFLFRQNLPWSAYGDFLKYSLIYSWCIGTLCMMLMPVAGSRLWRFRPLLRYLLFALCLAVLATIGCFLANVIFLILGMMHPSDFREEFTSSLRIGIAFTILIGAAATTFEVLFHRLRAANEELQRRLLEEERARKLATEARLSSLESRIHPHFLFNTLNSISALVREDPAKAERTVERLAALLRYSLDTGGRQLVPLRQELCVVHDYLEIEKTRFGDRLRYRIDIPAGLEDCEVPPMSLQLLVENSIKHAVSSSREGGEVLIAARTQGDTLRLAVTDDGPGFDQLALRHGHGLENLEERLAALFERGSRLELHREEGRMTVEVCLPFRRILV